MSTHDERYNDPIHGVIRPSDIYGDAPSHASLVAELLQTRTVLRELTEAVQTPKSGRRFFLAFKAALDLLAVEPVPVDGEAPK